MSRDYEIGQFTNSAGFSLAYQTIGSGPPVILANGLGGTFLTWRHLYRHLAERFQIISWDYRGLYGSEIPPDRSAISVERHVDDLRDLLGHLKIKRALFIGWSMGVQVNFELYRQNPEKFAGIGAINGTAGKPFETVLGQRLIDKVAPLLLDDMKRNARNWNRVAKLASAWDGIVGVFKKLGAVAPTLDEEVFADLVGEFGKLDFALYFDTLKHLGAHDAWDVLPSITVPTTIITGDKDIMTPVEAASRMSKLVAESRLLVLPGCTHYAPVERPADINRALDELIARCDSW